MENLISETEKFVVQLLNDKLDNKFVYHNLAHTQRVVEKTNELSELSQLSKTEKDILTISAWLHDTGFTVKIENHEDESAKIAAAFLSSLGCPQNHIETICSLILATKLEYNPKNQSEKIIRDADCSHIGSKNYMDISELLRKEWELACDKTLTEPEWLAENINFLTTKHRFHTNEASINWDNVKGKNLSQLIKSQKKFLLESSKLKHKKRKAKIQKE